ncbi:MAG: hypothetical protein U1G05_05610 [Kiritimatiellia bacterium]
MMKIGCFALMEPFTPMRRQFEVIRSLGIDYADLTDNHDGATLGTEYGSPRRSVSTPIRRSSATWSPSSASPSPACARTPTCSTPPAPPAMARPR